MIDAPYVCEAPRAGDGDSINCAGLRLRLVGIDAPELGRCPRYRACVDGNGQAAKRSLANALRLGPVRYRPVKIDRFGRTVAAVYAGRLNLSCWQLHRGLAIYKVRWDTGGIVARECRL